MRGELREFIVEELLDGQSITDSDDLLLSGLLDSLGVMRLVAFVEMDLETMVPPEDVTIDNFTSIDTLVDYIERRNGAGAGSENYPSGAQA